MFSDLELATEVYGSLIEARKVLANSVARIKGRCPDDEYRRYRKVVGDALGILIVEGMDPMLEQHPTLQAMDDAE
jgi:hypothetical protein